MSDGRRRFLERLVAPDGSNWREALAVRVTDEQLKMVAEHQPVALVILAKAWRRVEPVWQIDVSRNEAGL